MGQAPPHSEGRGHFLGNAGLRACLPPRRQHYLAFLEDVARQQRRKLPIRIQIRSFEAMCRMIEAGAGIGVLPLSAALRHRQTMNLAILTLNEPWADHDRAVIARDLEGLPGCARALIDKLIEAAETAGGSQSVISPELQP
ncbi:MAG: LysR substrate-binding domain-containing protein [Rhodoferax sp.]|nr:LysR substrate-binding domain-containing protein [Rhodoferax sp.]